MTRLRPGISRKPYGREKVLLRVGAPAWEVWSPRVILLMDGYSTRPSKWLVEKGSRLVGPPLRNRMDARLTLRCDIGASRVCRSLTPRPHWEVGPEERTLPIDECRVVVESMSQHTSTPGRCYFCIWEGLASLTAVFTELHYLNLNRVNTWFSVDLSTRSLLLVR